MQLLAAAVAGGGFKITLTPQNATRLGAGSGSPEVGIRLLNLGTKHLITADGPTWGSAIDTPQEWMNPKKAAANDTWSVKFTETAKDANFAYLAGSSSLATWHNLDTIRNVSGATNDGSAATATITIEISNDRGTTVVASATGNVLTSGIT